MKFTLSKIFRIALFPNQPIGLSDFTLPRGTLLKVLLNRFVHYIVGELFVPFEMFIRHKNKRTAWVTLSFQIFPSAAAAVAFPSASVVTPAPCPACTLSAGQI